jgi:hypothetical protein
MIYHITFASADMSISAQKCCESAIKNGANKTTLYTQKDLDPDFVERNKKVLSHERGAGYWLWKPYVIYTHLQTIGDDDVLIYTDAGVEIINPIQHLINAMDSDIMLFGNRWMHGDWCKMDVLDAMGCASYVSSEQLQASCIIVRKSALWFIRSWLEWSQMDGMIDDSPSVLPNIDTFREHRHDQAILTNLALINGVTFHWWCAQYSERYRHKYPNDKYPVTFQHHRRRNNEWN